MNEPHQTSHLVNIPMIQIAKCRHSGIQINHYPLRSSPGHNINASNDESKAKSVPIPFWFTTWQDAIQLNLLVTNQNLRQSLCFPFTRTLHSHKTWARTTSEYWAIKFQKKTNCHRHSHYQQSKMTNHFHSDISKIGLQIRTPRSISNISMGRNHIFHRLYEVR